MRQKALWVPRLACLILICAVSSGCGKAKPLGRSVTVNGHIILNGEPLSNVTVGFAALDNGIPAKYRYISGMTDSEGEYDIGGVYPGQYAVLLTDEPNSNSKFEDDPNKVTAVPGNPLLAKYSVNSPLRASVSADSTTHDFKIKATASTSH